MPTREEFISAYLRTRERNSDEDSWAHQQMMQLNTTNPQEAVEMTFALIDACQSDAQLAYIAAGPVEDLLWSRNEANFAVFATACERSPKVLSAMCMLGWAEEDPMYLQWKALLAKHGVATAQ